MTDPSRLELELADALGLTQAVRAAAADAASRVSSGKVRTTLARIDTQLATLQEDVNALVVASGARGRLTGRSARLRDTEAGAQDGRLDGADGLDALQALAAETAYALVQWQVVRRLAKAEGHKRARKLAARAVPIANGHLEATLKACDKVAKKTAKAVGQEA